MNFKYRETKHLLIAESRSAGGRVVDSITIGKATGFVVISCVVTCQNLDAFISALKILRDQRATGLSTDDCNIPF